MNYRRRPKPFVRIKFQAAGRRRPRWYWAIKLAPGRYKRVLPDGDECVKEKERPDGTVVCTQELLIGKPLVEKRAVMNLKYGELEVEKGD